MSDFSDSADASVYVRACGEPQVAGLHPAWLACVLVAIFFNHWAVQLLCLLLIVFMIIAKKNNATLFDMVRRIRRWSAGNLRKGFRSY